MHTIEQWGRYEWSHTLGEMPVGNPFTDVKLGAVVAGDGVRQEITGFYDGENTFRIRYMPGVPGSYELRTFSNLPALDGLAAAFAVTPATGENHGPVAVDGMHFRHADGSRFFVMGTTAYVWHHRPEEVRRQSLDSFSRYGFNKIRMLFFPKHYTGAYNGVDVSYEPPCYPFEGAPGVFDFRRPNPAYFRQFEARLTELEARNILADVILFHPYDAGHWNIDLGMDEDDALSYVRYLVARLAAFRGVWWSLANEYDIMVGPGHKHIGIGPGQRDWDVIGETVKARDPYGHPISIHNITFGRIYPNRSWMSHVSYQHPDTYGLMAELMAAYRKPVIDDEYQYEGNLPDEWGNCDARTELARHWRSAMAGGYATHGECFVRDSNKRDIFWAYGGTMTGESAPRLRFMKEIIEKCPFEEMARDPMGGDGEHYCQLRQGVDFFLIFMREGLSDKQLWAGDWGDNRCHGIRYKATYYDVWNCRKVKEEVLPPRSRLPFTPWTAVTLERITE